MSKSTAGDINKGKSSTVTVCEVEVWLNVAKAFLPVFLHHKKHKQIFCTEYLLNSPIQALLHSVDSV